MNDIGGDQALFAQFLGSEVTGQSVEVDTQLHGLGRKIALGQQRREDAREDVTTAGSGHAGIAGGVEVDIARGSADLGIVPLDHHEESIGDGQVARPVHAFETRLAVTRESVQFLRMRGENALRRDVVQPQFFVKGLPVSRILSTFATYL